MNKSNPRSRHLICQVLVPRLIRYVVREDVCLLHSSGDAFFKLGSIGRQVIKPVFVYRHAISRQTLRNHACWCYLDDVAKNRACHLVKTSGRELGCPGVVGASQSWVLRAHVEYCRDCIIWQPLGPEEASCYIRVSRSLFVLILDRTPLTHWVEKLIGGVDARRSGCSSHIRIRWIASALKHCACQYRSGHLLPTMVGTFKYFPAGNAR